MVIFQSTYIWIFPQKIRYKIINWCYYFITRNIDLPSDDKLRHTAGVLLWTYSDTNVFIPSDSTLITIRIPSRLTNLHLIQRTVEPLVIALCLRGTASSFCLTYNNLIKMNVVLPCTWTIFWLCYIAGVITMYRTLYITWLGQCKSMC